MAQFILRGTNADKQNIWLRLRTDGKEIRIPLHRTIATSAWDSSKQRPRNGKDSELRKDLNRLENEIDGFIASCRKNGSDYDDADIRALVDQVMGRVVVKTKSGEKVPSGILPFCDYYLEKTASGELLSRKGTKAALLTLRGWGTFRGILERYLAAHQKKYGTPLKWNGITPEIGEEFILWAESEGYNAATINKQISRFRSLGNLARDRYNLHHNGTITASLQFTEAQPMKHAYLTETELTALYQMELDSVHGKYRDVFLIMALSGQRISDCASIRKEDIVTENGIKVWRFKQMKTNEPIEIALVGALGEIFQRYDYQPPRVCEQVLNRVIKDILEQLSESVPSLKESVKVTNKKSIGITSEAEKEAEISVPRWKAISCHSGRRSAITNMLDSGRYSREQIMALSGHRSMTTFELYLSKSRSELSKETADIQVKAAAEAAKAGKPFLF
jgi:integrase